MSVGFSVFPLFQPMFPVSSDIGVEPSSITFPSGLMAISHGYRSSG